MFEWILAALSFTGTIYNLKHKAVCWAIWLVADACWVGSFIHRGLWPEALLFTSYCVLCIYGLIKWRTPKERS